MKSYISFLCILLVLCFVSTSLQAEETPQLLKVIPLSQTAIQLQYDGKLQQESSEDTSQYQITPNIKIDFALLDDRLNRVMLFTSPLEIGTTYQLSIRNTQKTIDITLADENEITFGYGNAVTFSGGLQDTSLIVNKDRKTRNNNSGAESTLLCNPTGTVSFIAFDLFDAFEDMGIREPAQVLDAKISLHVEKSEVNSDQTVILRRVLLPWKEGRGKSERAKEDELTYNSPLHRNLPWNKPPAQAMLAGIDGDTESDYNGSEDVANRIDGSFEIHETGKRYNFKSDLITDAVRFWVKNPDYNYGYLFALRDGSTPITFSSKEANDQNLRPILTIRYKTQSKGETIPPR